MPIPSEYRPSVMISVIIPAYNEEEYLPQTLDHITAAADRLRESSSIVTEIIVVDNDSTDATATVARDRGATVVHEPARSIARARNAGAKHAVGEILVFIDADVTIPLTLLSGIHRVMSDPRCVGGGVDVDYRPRRVLAKVYLRAWRLLARCTGMVQGATQFCNSHIFTEIGGYDEGAWIGEDVDFYWRMRKSAKSYKGTVAFIRSPRVLASTRRFDKWPLWKVLVWTNPVFIALLRRWKAPWSGWYSNPVR